MIIRSLYHRHAPAGLLPALRDALLLVALIGVVASVARVGSEMLGPFEPPKALPPAVTLDPAGLPFLVLRSTLRMFIALALSVLFALGYGHLAAHNRRAEQVMVPLLDILQSVPVLGFLSVTVGMFIGLFRGALLGLEAASIFAIFTGQVWNLTLSYYQSVKTVPAELREACKLYQLRPWALFRKLELPHAAIPFAWNAMMSFGGGWFFVAVSEAISVYGYSYTLPGVGSYVDLAIRRQQYGAIGWAIVAMAVMIVVVDQLIWRPLIVWVDRFKFEQTESESPPTSWVLSWFQSSNMLIEARRWLRNIKWPNLKLRRALPRFRPGAGYEEDVQRPLWQEIGFIGGLILVFAFALGAALQFAMTEVDVWEVLLTAGLASLTFLRVLAIVALSSVVWVPVGVLIGLNPKAARVLQPLAQFLASFPANFLFPFATALFIRGGLGLDIGGAFLMALGAQWYVLFNVIAGAQSIPSELREMASSFGLGGRALWRRLILPAIFPFWVTGAITASGGAWNASIVAEVVTWGDKTLEAKGVGAFIAQNTVEGDWPRVVLGVMMTCLYVLLANRLLWRPIQQLALRKYAL